MINLVMAISTVEERMEVKTTVMKTTKLAEGFYEIEAVRRKRIRKPLGGLLGENRGKLSISSNGEVITCLGACICFEPICLDLDHVCI